MNFLLVYVLFLETILAWKNLQIFPLQDLSNQ